MHDIYFRFIPQATTLFAEMIKKKSLREKLQQRQMEKTNSKDDIAIVEERRPSPYQQEGEILERFDSVQGG